MTGAARLLAAMLAMAELLVPADRRDWVWATRSRRGRSQLLGAVRLAGRRSAASGAGVDAGQPGLVPAGLRRCRCHGGVAAGVAGAVRRCRRGDQPGRRDRGDRPARRGRRWHFAAGAARWLPRGQPRLVRCAGYLAILGLVVVKAAVERAADVPPFALIDAPTAWLGEAGFLAIVVGYAAAIVACTAQRSVVRPPTLAAGVATGAVLGVLAYAVGPLGFLLRSPARGPLGYTTRRSWRACWPGRVPRCWRRH